MLIASNMGPMRSPLLLAVAWALAGCGSGEFGGNHQDLAHPGDASSGDLAGADLTASGDAGGSDDAAVDLAYQDLAPPPPPDMPPPPMPCAPSGMCKTGPQCGNACCNLGERCNLVNGTDTCMCGNLPACVNGNHCASAGAMGQNACGTICCGGMGGPPCPL